MPHMFRSFINIKKTFQEKFNGLAKGNGKSGIENMLEKLGLTFRGNKHSGLDDARNIAQIAIELMRQKVELRINQKCTYKLTQFNIKDHPEDVKLLITDDINAFNFSSTTIQKQAIMTYRFVISKCGCVNFR